MRNASTGHLLWRRQSGSRPNYPNLYPSFYGAAALVLKPCTSPALMLSSRLAVCSQPPSTAPARPRPHHTYTHTLTYIHTHTHTHTLASLCPGYPAYANGIMYIGTPDAYINAYNATTGGNNRRIEAAAAMAGHVRSAGLCHPHFAAAAGDVSSVHLTRQSVPPT